MLAIVQSVSDASPIKNIMAEIQLQNFAEMRHRPGGNKTMIASEREE